MAEQLHNVNVMNSEPTAELAAGLATWLISKSAAGLVVCSNRSRWKTGHVEVLRASDGPLLGGLEDHATDHTEIIVQSYLDRLRALKQRWARVASLRAKQLTSWHRSPIDHNSNASSTATWVFRQLGRASISSAQRSKLEYNSSGKPAAFRACIGAIIATSAIVTSFPATNWVRPS